MIRRLCVLTAMLLWSACAKSQSTYDTLGYHVIFKSDITTIVPSWFPYIDLEAEIPLGKNHALIVGGGPIIPLRFPAIMNGKTAWNREGYVITPSFKKYINRKKEGNNQMFVSFDLLFRESSFLREENFVHSSLNVAEQIYQDTITIHHQSAGFTLNFGQMLYFKNFGLEFSVGIGAEFMQHQFEGMLDPDADFEKKIVTPFWQKEEHIGLRLPTRLRIFWRV